MRLQLLNTIDSYAFPQKEGLGFNIIVNTSPLRKPSSLLQKEFLAFSKYYKDVGWFYTFILFSDFGDTIDWYK